MTTDYNELIAVPMDNPKKWAKYFAKWRGGNLVLRNAPELPTHWVGTRCCLFARDCIPFGHKVVIANVVVKRGIGHASELI